MIAKKIKKHMGFILIIGICIGVGLLLLILLFTGLDLRNSSYTNKLYPHVYIDNTLMSGKTKSEVLSYFNSRDSSVKNSSVFLMRQTNRIATYSAQSINLYMNTAEIFDKAYLVGRTPHTPTKIYQQISTIFGLTPYKFYTQVQYNRNNVKDDLEVFDDQYSFPAKNALFSFENNRVKNFQKEEPGNKVDISSSLTKFDEMVRALKFNPVNRTVNLVEHSLEPEVTLAQSNNFGIEELIGEGLSNYSHSIPGRIHNVILGASKLNGILIPKGKVFSFNEAIGDISASTGYQPAYIIKEGKTVLGDGGGICQVSSTLFRAALNSGLPIHERVAHAYRVSYYENDSKPGLDATVFAPSVDLKIENNTPSAILIQTSVDKEKMLLFFRLYGKKDGRNAEISTPILWDVSAPPPPIYQDDPTLKRGITKQIDFPAWGGKAAFNYKVTRNNEVMFEKKFVSMYKPWAAVYLIGTQD